ncbi:PilZ domain-containing protein [Marinobacterium sp. D7]|uniref:PilZ domain-containing protein n=1 Tax=Marinobacterium ramblicola TaxID=2849041 RepID=UPI001C2D8B40|nr:PilZ domain-containing protein [Marinobacterium ramblicola]
MDQDRRQFYRIDHPVVLDYKIVSEADVASSSKPYQFNVSPYFLLQSQLSGIDAECQHLVYKIAESTPHLATYLQHLNKKIDLIGRTLADSQLEVDSTHMQIINLSEGGLSFTAEEALELGTLLAIKLVFPENSLGLLLYAEVQRCEPKEQNFDIGIAFHKMPESCRTLLARLIIEAQARERQAQLHG